MAENWDEWKANYSQRGWDSYDSEPITPETIEHAKRLEAIFHDVPVTMNPAPGGDGSIGFEICWFDGREFHIDIIPGEEVMQAYLPSKLTRPK